MEEPVCVNDARVGSVLLGLDSKWILTSLTERISATGDYDHGLSLEGVDLYCNTTS
jgi:hypothetical protein